jgi:hypothetical protein
VPEGDSDEQLYPSDKVCAVLLRWGCAVVLRTVAEYHGNDRNGHSVVSFTVRRDQNEEVLPTTDPPLSLVVSPTCVLRTRSKRKQKSTVGAQCGRRSKNVVLR